MPRLRINYFFKILQRNYGAMSLPEQSLNPTLTVPDVTVPEVTITEVTVPEVTVPEVADHRNYNYLQILVEKEYKLAASRKRLKVIK